MTQTGPFEPGSAVGVVGQMLDALACAHGLGIVHRDVKPANVLLLRDHRVKMTDFGISRLDSSALTQTGAVLGTPSYMSPEQCRGDTVDARSDLFSTGVVLFQMISGRRPFTGGGTTEIALQVMSQPFPDLRSLTPGLPTALIASIERALAKRPDDRFATASEMATALRDAVRDVSDARDGSTVALSHTKSAVSHATLDTMQRQLAQHLGPIARHLVQNAARHANSVEELRDMVAQQIWQPELRSRFRNDTGGQATTGSSSAITPVLAKHGERELTSYLGPIARVMVNRALKVASSPDDFWQRLASHIERVPDREAFLKKRDE